MKKKTYFFLSLGSFTRECSKHGIRVRVVYRKKNCREVELVKCRKVLDISILDNNFCLMTEL